MEFCANEIFRNFKLISPLRFLCWNFLKFCNLTYTFGSLSLKSASPWARTALCTKENVVCDPTFKIFWPFSVGIFYSQQKMVKSLICVILFHRILNFSPKIYLPRLYTRAYSIYSFIVFGGTPKRLSGTFWPKNISAKMVFLEEKVWL